MIRQNLCKIFLLLFLQLTVFILKAQIAHHPTQSVTKEYMQKGETLYKKYCLVCHQADGYGVPNMNPPLIKTNYVTGDKKRLINWVLKGSGTTKISIDGKTYNNKMPAQNYLKDDEIANILTYIRNSFGNKASVIRDSDVKNVRAEAK